MKNKKLLAGMLAAVLSVTTICSTTNVMQAQETTGTTQASEIATETGDVVTQTVADENGFVIENGVLVSYEGDATSVVIPDGVTAIGDYAFEWCSSLTEIVIPDSVATIGDFAFYMCYDLTKVVIPDSVTTIGDYAFSDCSSLTEIVIPDSVTTIGEAAFWLCSSLTEIVIPDSVTTIGDFAFSDCSGLTELVIPDSVTTIGKGAFDEVADNFTIHGYANSYAQQYAEENDFTFVVLEEEPEQPEGDKPSDGEKPSEPTEPEKPSEEQKPSEPSKPVYTPDDFAELLERQDIVIKPNDYVTITFAKGSELNDTTGKTEFNFATTVTTDYTNTKLPAFITKDSFITKVSYTYSGVLPATANIEISVGKDYAGKEVFYFLLNEDGTFDKNKVQKAKVNENGVITVTQEHCSDYVVTTVNPETLYAATQTPNEDTNTNDSQTSTENNGNANNGTTNTDTDSKESPKTGDNILFRAWCTVILSGIMAIFAYRRRHA